MSAEKIFHALQASDSSTWRSLLNKIHEAAYLVDRELNLRFMNEAAELLAGFSNSEIVDKPCYKNLLIQYGEKGLELCIKKCPVELAYTDGQIHMHKAYLRHKDGHLFPVDMRVIPLSDSRGIIISVLEAFLDASPRVLVPQKIEELERTDLLDPLISQGNRRYLEMHIHSRLEETKRYNIPFGLLYMCVDNIHAIDDKYGSKVKDRILQTISQTLIKNIRFFEVAGRWEQEEFVLVLTHLDEMHLEFVANKLRLLIEQSTVREKDILLKPTVSVGATLVQLYDNLEIIINRAKKLVENSRQKGKNRVSLRHSDD